MTAPDGYFEVVKTYRLWSDVTEEERLTVAQARAIRPRVADFVFRRIQDRLDNRPCAAATPQPEYRGLWLPCGREVADGAEFCVTHGGPRKGPERKPNLRTENEALRRRIAELEAKTNG